MINRKDVIALAGIHGSDLISIYLPTHRKGTEVLQREDLRNFNKQLKDIKEDLSQKGLSTNEVNELLLPLADLARDADFWNNQSEGLAVFLGNGVRQEHRLPIAFEARYYVSTGFLLWPLLPLLENDSEYYLLTLSLRKVALYRASQFEISKIRSKELENISFEGIVGSDYEQKNLQWRSHHAVQAQTTYHGQGEGHEDHSKEIAKYFRAVDQVLDSYFKLEHLPIVLAGLDQHIGAFRALCDHANIMAEYVSGNPVDAKLTMLHEESWKIVRSTLARDKIEKIDRLIAEMGTSKTELDMEKIIPASFLGKVDTLLLRKGFEVWGIYDPIKRAVRYDKQHHTSNVSLVNLLCIEILRKGGNVFILDREDMPDQSLDICALYRY
jgi:hypothetical protein